MLKCEFNKTLEAEKKRLINSRILQNYFPLDKTNFLTLFPAATTVFPGVLFKQIDADDKDLNTASN